MTGADSASGSHDAPPGTAPFGRRNVGAADKASLVAGVFNSVAARYDLMNDLMSFGTHRLWRQSMVAALELMPGDRLLDLAGGTGDMALRVRKSSDAHVTICDISPAMLRTGRRRAWNHGVVSGIDWICGDAEACPFHDEAFGACTIAFGLRNVTHTDQALEEIRRVLRPGARFLCLEFSPDVAPAIRGLYDVYSERLIPLLGEAVVGDRGSYQYLVESIRRFPGPDRLSDMIAAAGFSGVRYRRRAGGIAVLHTAWRI